MIVREGGEDGGDYGGEAHSLPRSKKKWRLSFDENKYIYRYAYTDRARKIGGWFGLIMIIILPSLVKKNREYRYIRQQISR